jgi:hypothetical protein
MWYHWLGALVAVYMLITAAYDMFMGYGPWYTRFVFNGIYIAIGLAIGGWAMSGINAPSPMAEAAAMMRGGRKWWSCT